MLIISAVAATLLAIISVLILDKLRPMNLSNFRYLSIDGARGYLAFFVFLHHSSIWYWFVQSGVWTAPPSNLYKYFGTGSVMVFFMVTAFLFVGRLLDKQYKEIDWTSLYVSRILRICPLFIFSVSLSFLLSAYVNEWDFKKDFLIRLVATFGMGIFQAPIVEGFNVHGIGGPVMAGVLWTLPYEWLFYFTLPVFAIILRIRVVPVLLFLPFLVILYQLKFGLSYIAALPFVSGVIAAVLVRQNFLKKFASGKAAAVICFLMVGILLLLYDNPVGPYSQVVLAIVFYAIVSGNSFFGLLTSKFSRILGEISYSMYLLHGLSLYFLFRVVLGDSVLVSLSETNYWFCVVFFVPFLICFCYMTFLLIEKPMMSMASSCSERLKLFSLKKLR